jgi:predicted ATPase/DNA-binding SARP family transcriptional activator
MPGLPNTIVPQSAAVPTPATTFIGREREVAAFAEAITSARLVTLTGAGGSGKTRLATEVARKSAERFADGVAWIELAAVLDPDLVATHVATTLGIGGLGRTPTDALRDALRESEVLIVLDNCEHVVDSVAATVELLLRECPDVRVLATSREALGIAGERAWLIPVLSLPADAGLVAASQSEAVRLFVERAHAANGSFSLTEANADVVARLCRRLDGLPLAIELAAARARGMTPEQMLARIDDGHRILETGHRATGGRHRTLRATIDWSYELLDDRERRVLQRASVFAGEFSIDAAEVVCSGGDVATEDVLDIIAALVDKSLVVVREQVDEARYYLLETIRQYGRDQLARSSDEEAAKARHASFFANLVRTAAPHLITPARPAWVSRLQRELDDLRVALSWARTHDRLTYVELAGLLGWFWYSSGLWTEGRRWIEDALSLPEARVPDHRRAAALFAAGVIASLQGHGALARQWLEESSALARSLGDGHLAAYSDSYIGVALGQEGLPAAEAPTRAALAWFETTGDLYGRRLALVVLATLLIRQGDLPAARAVGEEAVRVAWAYGLGRELGIALQVLGTVRLHQRELAGAAYSLGQALRALREDPQPFWLARALELMGVIECTRGRPVDGVRLFGAADALRERIGAVMFHLDRDRLAPHLAAARTTLGDTEFADAWDAGRALPLDEVIEIAVANADAQAPVPSAKVVAQAAASPSGAAIRVRVLGSLDVEANGEPLPLGTLKYARSRELLAYLLVHPDGRTREQVGAALWPGASPAQVKNNFHVTLHHLRRALGRADLVVFADDEYRMNWTLGIDVDAAVFERDAVAARRALGAHPDSPESARALLAAIDLYRGDFLAGDTAGDWHLEIRDRLQRVWVEALAALGEFFMKHDRYEEAIDIYRRLTRADEMNEDAHRRLMTALARSGHRGEALRHYDRLVTFFEREVGSEPDSRTSALHDRLRRAEVV